MWCGMMMISGAGSCREQDPPCSVADGSCLPAEGHEQSQDKADCIYTNIDLPQTEPPSQLSSQSLASFAPQHLICQHPKEAAAIEQHSYQP
ncbi:2645_t:CDS:2 [Scutellospora calospora]|uniref:2645_t:CDS:1 n=1 Tax=Scutellospora calospora TaxID=85575 RepID=A0ACA9N5M0_9GLOM|nr:2645_t:CDS:2 [Scutellospora calospora]